MFVDKVKIHIKGGDGGNGAVSFYRAKYVPNGGPDGGDGGRGGNIVFITDPGMNTLMDFRFKKIYKAERGKDGGKRNCSGGDGGDTVIKVPVGTVIREESTGKIMADMAKPNERRIIIKGGRGGKGNQHFATPSRQAPKYAEKGKASKEYDVILELKLIADVGLIGFPNVGKSTILSMATNANPKIANYHFTTLSPNLGVVRSKGGNDFVMADIPGLIEGASQGAGLGREFLRHVERTKVFIHVADAAALEGIDPVENIEKINAELFGYNEELRKRPMIIAANKTDITGAEKNAERIKEAYPDMLVFPISAAMNKGIDELIAAAEKLLRNYPKDITFNEDFEEFEEEEEEKKSPFTISRDGEVFVVEGKGVEKMMGYTNTDTEKGFAFFQRYLREKGIVKALEEAGINEGDTVRIYDEEFDYYKS